MGEGGGVCVCCVCILVGLVCDCTLVFTVRMRTLACWICVSYSTFGGGHLD